MRECSLPSEVQRDGGARWWPGDQPDAGPTKLLDIDIVPVGKPRMTRQDKFLTGSRKRPAVARYHAFEDELLLKVRRPLPNCGIHIVFHLPMPTSWSQKKRDKHRGQPHQQKPDRDNLEKAFIDVLMKEDCGQWDARTTKVWADAGRIVVWRIGEPHRELLR